MKKTSNWEMKLSAFGLIFHSIAWIIRDLNFHGLVDAHCYEMNIQNNLACMLNGPSGCVLPGQSGQSLRLLPTSHTASWHLIDTYKVMSDLTNKVWRANQDKANMLSNPWNLWNVKSWTVEDKQIWSIFYGKITITFSQTKSQITWPKRIEILMKVLKIFKYIFISLNSSTFLAFPEREIESNQSGCVYFIILV